MKSKELTIHDNLNKRYGSNKVNKKEKEEFIKGFNTAKHFINDNGIIIKLLISEDAVQGFHAGQQYYALIQKRKNEDVSPRNIPKGDLPDSNKGKINNE